MSRLAPDDLSVRPHLQRSWMKPRAKRKKLERLLRRLKTSTHEWNTKYTAYGRTSNSPSPRTPWSNYLAFQCPLGVWDIEYCVHLGHVAAGTRRAVSGSYTYGGKVHLAHRSVLCDEQWPWGVLFQTITNVLDMLIENIELININVHNFWVLLWLENP